MSGRKDRLLALLAGIRAGIDQVVMEVHTLHEDDAAGTGESEEVMREKVIEARARIRALEFRVQAIEGGTESE